MNSIFKRLVKKLTVGVQSFDVCTAAVAWSTAVDIEGLVLDEEGDRGVEDDPQRRIIKVQTVLEK